LNMIRSLWISKTCMEGQQTKLDAISNNLANVGTNGYKRSGVVFEDLMYQNLRQAGAASSEQSQLPSGLQLGLGVRAAATSRNFSQGTLSQTNGNFDVAIEGQGFFQVQMPDGSTSYTRDGGFQLNASGDLVTSAGYTWWARCAFRPRLAPSPSPRMVKCPCPCLTTPRRSRLGKSRWRVLRIQVAWSPWAAICLLKPRHRVPPMLEIQV